MEHRVILNEFGFMDVFATLRTDPEWILSLEEAYPGIKDGFNMQAQLGGESKCGNLSKLGACPNGSILPM